MKKVSIILTGVVLAAQTPASFTATTDNVAGAHDSIRIDVLRWSTDAERDQLLFAWTQPGSPVTGGRGPGGRGGRPVPEFDPFGAGNDPAALASLARGAGGRGGRGGRGGGAEAPRPAPEAALKAALGNAAIVGHLWSSSEVAGYSLCYAVRLAGQDGAERIILITDRRLGAWNDLWKPADAATSYEFSVIELRLNSKGEGEGKTSLSGKVVVDSAAKTFTLENYGALPVVLKTVKWHRL